MSTARGEIRDKIRDDSRRDDYTLHRTGEIVAILERLRIARALATVEFGDGHAIVSSLLELRRDCRVMIFDIARDPDQNRRLFASQRLSFVTELDNIPIAFETGAASLVNCADGPAALVKFPASLVRLQRREWFRVPLPLDPPIRCTVLDARGNASPALAVDLSCGGAGLIVEDHAGTLREPGSEHELILSLPEVGHIALDAKLSSVKSTQPSQNGAASKIRVGFRFEAVPAKIASQIQRYVNRVELMRKKN